MKKLLLLTLVLLGGVMQVSAATKRIYVKTDANWMQYCGGKTYLYIKDGSGDITPASPGIELTLLKGEYGKWGTGLLYADIDNIPDTEVNFVINKGNDDWKTGDCSGTLLDKTTIYWYSSGGSGNTNVEVMPDAWYLVSWTDDETNRTATALTLSSNAFSVQVDKPTKDTYYCIAPTIALNREKKNIDFWDEVFLPSETTGNYAIYAFNTYSGNISKTNSYCWVFQSYVNAKSVFSGNLSSNTFTITPYREATIGDAGYITYSNGEKCKVTGATRYTVSTNNTTSVTMAEQDAETIWPESAGMILKGEPDAIVTISAVASDATATTIGTNYLKGTGNSAAVITATEYTYVFANDATYGVGFYLATESGELAAHKAYLDLSTAGGKAGEFLSFNFDEEETDGISKVANANFDANAQVYNLAGQKVGANYKGIVIVNGKKVLRK